MVMARPKGRQEPRMTMSIRVSAHEKKIINEKAKEQGMDVSAYVRHMALHGGVIDPQAHEDRRKLIQEISAVGNNVNQITRLANTSAYVSTSQLSDIQGLLQQIQELVIKSMERQVA
jgi:hypothetical protein